LINEILNGLIIKITIIVNSEEIMKYILHKSSPSNMADNIHPV